MDNEVTTTSTVSGTATIRWRALPRRWVLLGVAGLLIAIAVLVPLALTMSRSALYAVAPNAQTGQDMDGSPQRSPDAPYATGESAGAGVAADVSEEPASAQPWAVNGTIIAERPRMSSTLKMLLPTTLPRAMSV